MNEAKIMLFLNKFYEALQILEEIRDEYYKKYLEDDDCFDELDFLEETYEELFEWTNTIEIHYGLLEE